MAFKCVFKPFKCILDVGKVNISEFRHLFSPAFLGINGYLKARERTLLQFQDIEEKFLNKMNEVVQNKERSMIFTDDLKNIIHLVREDKLSLVMDMIIKFNAQNRGMRFGTYIFGPVVMRLYYYLDSPAEALNAVRSKDLDGFFDQISSYHTLMDLLYEHKQYQDVIEVFEELQEKRLNGQKYPKNCFTIAMASCYKMNTPDSFEKAQNYVRDALEYGTVIPFQAIAFLSHSALLNHHPHVALEVLHLAHKSSITSIRNLKVMALASLDRIDEALVICRVVMQSDLPDHDRHKKLMILEEMLYVVEAAVKKTLDKVLLAEFNNIKNNLERSEYISKETLEDILCQQIEERFRRDPKNQDRAMLEASYNRTKSYNDRSEKREYNNRNKQLRYTINRPGLIERE